MRLPSTIGKVNPAILKRLRYMKKMRQKRLGAGKKFTASGQRARLGKRMAGMSRRYARKPGKLNKVRSTQMSNLSGLLSGKKKMTGMKGIKYSSPVRTAEFVNLMNVKSGGRGVVAGKNLKPAKPKKKLKAKKVKGTRGYRGSGGPSPLPIATAFSPSPLGGSAKSLGIKPSS